MSDPQPSGTAVSPAGAAFEATDVETSTAPAGAVLDRPSRARRVGVMGGTFDPIHHGHLVAASEVASLFELDEVVFVPTGESWQKDNRRVSSAEDRYLMTVIATASNPRFSVSRVDIDRGGPTYTVDTLRELRAERSPGTEFFFITGADALEQIFTWQDADELFDMAHFVGCTRPGHALADPGLPVGKVSLIEVPALAISSTACRERVRRGEPVWYLVPDGIVQYINKRGLYRDPGDTGAHLGRPHEWGGTPDPTAQEAP
jgi:nicotinate-nucleotide adenylyltransferase